MVPVKFRHLIWSAHHIRAVEPRVGHKFLFAHVLNHMLWKGHEIPCIGAVKRNQGHGGLGGEADGLVVHLGDSFHMVGAFLHESVIPNAFEHIIHHGHIANGRAAYAQGRIYHIVCCHGLPVRPDRLVVNMHKEIPVILSRNRIRQHSLKVHILVQLHERKEHKAGRVFVHLHPVHQKGVQGIQGISHADIHDFLPGRAARGLSCLGLSRCPASWLGPIVPPSLTSCQRQGHNCGQGK